MNRKSKVIVSIVGITIVLLALLGITYAYYLTRIEGNTNTNSISITTADLKLKYGDGTTNILTKENIVPDNNNPVGTKDFSVTNTGNTTIDNYSVVLEYAVIDGVVPSVFKYPNDFEITLNCIDNEGNVCNGTKINFNNEAVTLTTASIDPNEVHNYTLEIYYRDSGIDQSDDMGKNLNLKVQIYEVRETTDINGTITGVDENYTVKLTSDPKISPIVKNSDGSYSYAFSGVEIGTHTLRVINKDGEEVSNQKIVIQKGNSVGFSTAEVDEVEVPLITVNESNRVISLTTNVNTTSSTVTNSGTSVSAFNPYESNKNSLAYNIIKNAKEKKNGTELTNTPLTSPANETSKFLYKTHEAEIATTESSESITTKYQSRYWTYATDYIVDETTGKFSLVDPKVCLYNDTDLTDNTEIECDELISTMVSKGETVYIISTNVSSNTNTTATLKTTTNISNIYLVTTAPVSSTSTITMKAKKLTSISYSLENSLSLTTDDYGTSYYYRGSVEDNYVNFAGMCWRIVRIAGDGSTKLILEDQYTTCDDTETETTSAVYTGNWNIGKGNYGYDSSSKSTSGSILYKMNYLNPVTNNTSSMVKAFYDFQITKLADYTGKLKSGDWCLGDKAYTRSGSSGSYTYTLLEDTSSNYLSKTSFYYDAYTRLTSGNANGYQPTLKCNGTILNEFADVSGVSSKSPMYVSAITADEIVYAGGKYGTANGNYYLINNYQKSNNSYFWSLSPSIFNGSYDLAFSVVGNGRLDSDSVDGHDRSVAFRPAVSLVSSAVITSGEGTLESPYVIG